MTIPGEDGYELWLRYRRVDDPQMLAAYQETIAGVWLPGGGATAGIIRSELERALPVLLDRAVPFPTRPPAARSLLVGTIRELEAAGIRVSQKPVPSLGDEGFLIRSHPSGRHKGVVITGNSEAAVLTGVFYFLRLVQMHREVRGLNVCGIPGIRNRILCHWDNIDGTVERGYSGWSLWKWGELPAVIDPRYRDYARACASIGINGVCLNNVNAQAESLSTEYLVKTAALAELFRPYGIRVFLSPLYSAPMQLGGLATSDPRNPAVAGWWRRKVDEIYRLVPDFGGFQVKADSEGQPGPRDYGVDHAAGANLLAKALEPYGGILLWRAFVYEAAIDPDRAKCAYKDFVPLDGKFRPNVFLQAKNGPIDFQPREPFHPLFGAMQRTPLALELQITQEYLGQSIHLVYLAGMWKEVLDSDTFARGPDSTVAKNVAGSVSGRGISAIVGVANTGSERNWCGHHFSQANWYAFGRLAWDCGLSAEEIADEWVRITWSNDPRIGDPIREMMLKSWAACVNYMTPLGLHHIMAEDHHYGPDPAFASAKREDWNSVYYHRADTEGIGFDRSSAGSGAVGQYHEPLRGRFDDPASCPEEFLLWFHHVSWNRRLSSGRTLWEELQRRYQAGVDAVEEMAAVWRSLDGKIDRRRHEHVRRLLIQQLENARFWRDVCINYFGQYIRLKKTTDNPG
jgi:alpha-glucuronidase